MSPTGSRTGWRMSRREAVLSGLVVVAAALTVRLWAASQITFAAPEDTAYYVAVAEHLLNGRGLVSDAMWTYATPPLVYPRPAFEIWLPLPTFLAAIPMVLLGQTFAAAQWSSILVGAAVPLLAWRLAADVAAERGLTPGRARSVALGTGLTSAVYLPLVLHSALPDSTMPFAALALAACLVMGRLTTSPTPPGAAALAGLGLLMGLAALARNEAAWLALAWLVLVWRRPVPLAEKVRQVGLTALVAVAAFAPWAIRNWIAFGNPLPGQALSNALSLEGRDIFAWQEKPTLARYLAAGPSVWVGSRIVGIGHNVINVLLVFGVPMSLLGMLALPRTLRSGVLRPLIIVSGLTFAAASLLFPVATTWGTFLHAAGPVHVLLIISCLLALDDGIAWLGRRRQWTRPVAWLGPILGLFAGILFTAVLLPSFGADGRLTAAKYAHLRTVVAELGSAGGVTGPIISDFPIWVAEELGVRSLALPNEPPASVLDLASRFPGTGLLIVDAGINGGRWPAILDERGPGSECFQPIPMPEPADPLSKRAVEETRLYRVACP